jgi:imidazolonepropionase-like amidohydrolase
MIKRLKLFVPLVLVLLTACSGISGNSLSPTLAPEPTLNSTPLSSDCYGYVPEGPPIVLVGGVLIDGTGGDPVPNAAIVIQGCRISSVGTTDGVSIPTDAQIIDLDGATMLPGLINAHVHAAYSTVNLRAWAQAGVTTVRDLGAAVAYDAFAARDRFAIEPANARVVSAGPLVTVPGGYPIVPNNFPSLAITSPEDARQQITRLIDEGADVIKITFSSRLPTLSPEEAAAIVQTAHKRGIPVTAHATNLDELKRALDAGVDDVAHICTESVPNRILQHMVSTGVYWVPTLEALHGEGEDNLLRFMQAGGKVAMGTDAGYLAGLEIGSPLDEFALMQEAGMTPMEIILASTRNSAHVCRLEQHLGTLEVGKLADVLVVNGDPLQDMRVLANVRMVIHGGVIIRE